MFKLFNGEVKGAHIYVGIKECCNKLKMKTKLDFPQGGGSQLEVTICYLQFTKI